MDLHAWITERVDATHQVAARAATCTAADWEAIGSLIVTTPIKNGEKTAGDAVVESSFHTFDDALVHAARHDPAAILSRCEADRRILARHNVDPTAGDSPPFATACDGCGCEWVQDDCEPNTENINDCPELLDLAHAHGITEAELAGLDRPQPPERKPSSQRISHWLTVPITTTDVPAALRGPNWTSHT